MSHPLEKACPVCNAETRKSNMVTLKTEEQIRLCPHCNLGGDPRFYVIRVVEVDINGRPVEVKR